MGPRRKQNELSVEEIEAIAKFRDDALEQYSRRENIRLHNVNENEREHLLEVVLSIVNAAKSFKGNEDTPDVSPDDLFTKKDISVCHRVGSKAHGRNHSMKPRQILVRFISRQSIQSIFRCKKNLKKTSCNDVTVLRLRLKAIIKDTPGVTKVHTRDGNIVFTKDGRVNTVSSPDDLHKTGIDVDLKALGLEDLG
ncbi:hypothetical protein MAR_020208 [Mya arenaria]|uniref:Uncharacterized protein n=1 Tax=Mya arenaria TaxID=6604 RepID=A0ABY7E6R0_MYAAR|nr:hypothetical protein MAR_020208 [Mya arenaria]